MSAAFNRVVACVVGLRKSQEGMESSIWNSPSTSEGGKPPGGNIGCASEKLSVFRKKNWPYVFPLLLSLALDRLGG